MPWARSAVSYDTSKSQIHQEVLIGPKGPIKDTEDGSNEAMNVIYLEIYVDDFGSQSNGVDHDQTRWRDVNLIEAGTQLHGLGPCS